MIKLSGPPGLIDAHGCLLQDQVPIHPFAHFDYKFLEKAETLRNTGAWSKHLRFCLFTMPK